MSSFVASDYMLSSLFVASNSMKGEHVPETINVHAHHTCHVL